MALKINSSHKKDILILMTGLNAKVGADNHNVEHVMDKSIGSRNENGDMLIEACSSAELKIGGSSLVHGSLIKKRWGHYWSGSR